MKRFFTILLILLLLCACVQKPQNETAQATAQAHAPESDMTQADTPPVPDHDGPTPVVLFVGTVNAPNESK